MKSSSKMFTIFTIGLLLFALLPINSKASASVQVFEDVSPSHPYYNEIYSLYAKQAINGYENDWGEYYFKPSQTVTRGEAAKMVSYVTGLEVDAVQYYNFKDLEVGAWYYNPIAAMIKEGFLKGYPDGTIQPKGTLTRAEMAKIIALSYGYKQTTSNLSHFKDVKKNAWYAPFVGALVESGITGGTSANTFSPAKKISRQELAAFLYRAHNGVHAEQYNDGQSQNLLTETQVKINDLIQTYKYYQPSRPSYSVIRDELLEYAMPTSADSWLKEYYETSCTDCDHILFDIPMSFDLHYNVIEQTNERITLETATPENELTSGHFAEITLIKHKGKWKLEEYISWSFEERPLDISREQAQKYIADSYSQWLKVDSVEYSYYNEYEDLYYFDVYTKDGDYFEVTLNRSTGYMN